MRTAASLLEELRMVDELPAIEAKRCAWVDQPSRDLRQLGVDLHQYAADLHQFDRSLPRELVQKPTGVGARPRSDARRALVLELCALDPESAAELAALLGDRDAKNLVRLHLGPMLEGGQLAYTIPKMPNHPQQKYTLAEGSKP